jgi:Transketolase, C-terminal domain
VFRLRDEIDEEFPKANLSARDGDGDQTTDSRVINCDGLVHRARSSKAQDCQGENSSSLPIELRERPKSSLTTMSAQQAVLDLRWLNPLDEDALFSTIKAANGRVLIAHEAVRTGGFAGEIAMRI